VFDRSSVYSLEKFDINKELEQFVKVIASYALMTDAELGLNTFIKRDGHDKYIVAQEVNIYLEDKPIASTKAIVCRGTTCYRGRRFGTTEWEYVVKFAWSSDKRKREGRLLNWPKREELQALLCGLVTNKLSLTAIRTPSQIYEGLWNLGFRESYRAKHCGSKTKWRLAGRIRKREQVSNLGVA
jgi:hypothetical protein